VVRSTHDRQESVPRFLRLKLRRSINYALVVAAHIVATKTRPRLARDEIVAVEIGGSPTARLKPVGVLGIGTSTAHAPNSRKIMLTVTVTFSHGDLDLLLELLAFMQPMRLPPQPQKATSQFVQL
jgi:hypothetical protein